MFNSNNGYSLADLAAVTGNGFGGFGGGEGLWLIILFALFALGGWGGGFGGFGGWGMNGLGFGLGMDGLMMWPWMMTQNTDNIVQGGFNQAATANTLSGLQSAITSGFGDTALGIAGINQNICQTGNSITGAITNGFAQSEIAAQGRNSALTQQLFNNEINSLNRSFAEQTANTQGFTTLSSDLASCCCENRLGLANLNSTILSENCADRQALSDGIRDVLAATQAQTQTILDKLCQQEIDNLKDRNAELRTQVQMQNLAASQTAQTAALTADNAAQTQYIVNRVAPYPIPAYQVGNPYGYPYYGYGNWNGNGCGCGYNGFVA